MVSSEIQRLTIESQRVGGLSSKQTKQLKDCIEMTKTLANEQRKIDKERDLSKYSEAELLEMAKKLFNKEKEENAGPVKDKA